MTTQNSNRINIKQCKLANIECGLWVEDETCPDGYCAATKEAIHPCPIGFSWDIWGTPGCCEL